METPHNRNDDWLDALLQLTKARITLAVTGSTATGWILFAQTVSLPILYPIVGVFLLACGCAALNEVQEARLDAKMARTAGRPIPAGRIDPLAALFFAVTFILLGFYFLASIDRHLPAVLLLGLLAVVWYNGVYTYLKRRTPFAVLPGALVGAIPPIIGWAAAGGLPSDPAILLVACFFFIWQVPHFWLLMLMRADEYARAGLPTPATVFAPRQLSRITFIWILATAAAGLVLTLLIRLSLPWNVLIFAASIWLALQAVRILRTAQPPDRRAFLQLIAYAAMVMLFLCLNALT